MTLRALIVSIILHVVLLGLLVLSFDFSRKELVIQPQDVMQAVSVDSAQVEKEISALKQRDKEKELAEKKLEQKLEELEAKARAADQKRTQREKELAELEQKTEAEKKEAEAAQEKLAEINQKQEELENKKQQEEKERKTKEAADAAKKKSAEEEKNKKAAQAAADAKIISALDAPIRSAITRNFNLVGLPPGLSCTLFIRMVPGGEVVGVQVEKSSGNPVFDQRAKDAVYQASPLPVPTEQRIFEKMRDLRLEFEP